MFSISLNHISLPFFVVNSCSCPIRVILAVSREIALKLASFSLKILIYGENCHSWILLFSQMVRSEITFTLDWRKFWSRLITSLDLGHWTIYFFNILISVLSNLFVRYVLVVLHLKMFSSISKVCRVSRFLLFCALVSGLFIFQSTSLVVHVPKKNKIRGRSSIWW